MQLKLRILKELTDRSECNINDSQSDIVEELIHVQTAAMLLNEGACKSGPHSLTKIECTHCKNYIYM